MEAVIPVFLSYPILAHPPQAATLGWGRGLEDTYGQNVTISPSVVFEPAGPPVGSRYHSWKRHVEKAAT